MKIYRCNICGDVFIGREMPSECPFCGVKNIYLTLGSEWSDKNQGVELTPISQKNLMAALDLELHATAFYNCVSQQAEKMELQSMFKGLAKVELEHAFAISKLLRIPKDQLIKMTDQCNKDAKAMLEETRSREDNAVKEYVRGAQEAVEERVKEIFVALAAVEKGHLILVEEIIKKTSLS